MKKLIVSENCVSCGMCVFATDLLKEDTSGKAVPVELGIVSEDKIAKIQEVIDSCPVKAISMVNTGIVKSLGKQGLNELKKIIEDKLGNYKVEFPDSKYYEFNKSEFSTPTAHASGEYGYEYKSDEKAERAGLREFDRIMYSQRKAIIQQLLVEYKNKKLHKYSYYEKEKGNFYHDVNQNIEKMLKEFLAEAQVLSGNKLILPKEFDTFEVIPQMGISGDKVNKELYVYQLRHIEELWFTQNIMNELESLSWYDTYIDTDDMEDHRGKYVYCYKNISNVCSLFGKHILDEFSYVLNGLDGVRKIMELPINKFCEEVSNNVKVKSDILIKAIENVKL